MHQLEETRALEEGIYRNSEKRLLHPFVATEGTIKTPVSHTGVAVAAASSAFSTRPQLVQTPRQRVPTKKMERLGIETSPGVLESAAALAASAADVGSSHSQDEDGIAKEAGSGAVDDTEVAPQGTRATSRTCRLGSSP